MTNPALEATAPPGLLDVTARDQVQSLDSRLDSLWTEYLDLLDQYTQARDEISKLMSSGFFSLAQANKAPMNGRRYGQDWYDQRMKATRRCRVVEHSQGIPRETQDSRRTHLDLLTRTPAIEACSDAEAKPEAQHQSKDSEPEQQPSPPQTPSRTPSPSTEKAKDGHLAKTAIEQDPIRWYGILVAPDLRRAQAAFTTAFSESSKLHPTLDKSDPQDDQWQQGPLIRAANAARMIKAVDAEIRRLRKFVKKADKAATESKHQEPGS